MRIFSLLFALALFASATINAQNLIQDPGFETGRQGTAWTQSSTNFGTPLCSYDSCGNGGGSCIARSGNWFVWFGGISSYNETGSIIQSLIIPSDTAAKLKFWYKLPAAAANGTDYIKVYMDNNVVWSSTNADSSLYDSVYKEITVNIAAYANGLSHTFKILSYQSGTPGLTNMLVDDISITTATAGIYESFIDEGITVYPNPTTDIINIKFDKQASNLLVVYLYDIGGKKVFEQKKDNNTIISLNVSGFKSGNYFLRIGDDKQNIVVKKITIK
ncbi:MAG: T9SS type A sorting domain-containing protein [Bacteroidetes bacterium]|nr:T9SS type A sorting domain-containing protein [Bacteroidota bacterium]